MDKLVSTRGAHTDGVSCETAILMGYAADGGMFMPQTLTQCAEWTTWRSLPYVRVLAKVLQLFLPADVPVAQIIDRVSHRFRHKDIVGVHRLDERTVIAEMFHGPTYAFKDYSLLVLGQIMEHFMRRTEKKHVWLIGECALHECIAICSHIRRHWLVVDGSTARLRAHERHRSAAVRRSRLTNSAPHDDHDE